MGTDLFLIWLLVFLSAAISLLSSFNAIKQWPKISLVILFSNIFILSTYYSDLYGVYYYLANILKTIPAILLLVYLARKDPRPNWSYRATCLILVLQTIIYGIHILSDLSFAGYGICAEAVTYLELVVLLFGGLNVSFTDSHKIICSIHSVPNCSTWVKRNIEIGK